ncbi:hypothetical protein [Catenulispora rubra]|uniref:hypothetical protein n=1 Tax=Catenulispora rubra TaxID=280293 RepID=UPI00189259CE|nr:hypothetical protein [Catenulispora rubra]
MTPDFLAWASRQWHEGAQFHWHAHGATPIKVVLFTTDGVPEMVDVRQGIGQEATGAAIREHAQRIGAVAVAITAMSRMADVEYDVPLPAVSPGLPLRPAVARVVGEMTHSIVTLTVWPDRDVSMSLRSDIRTGAHRTAELSPTVESGFTDPPQLTGLAAWLTGLLPTSRGSATS